MRYIELTESAPIPVGVVIPTPEPELKLYCVHVTGREWSVRHWVRAADRGKAIRYVRNRNQEFYNNNDIRFSTSVQDDSKGVVFGAPY